MYWLISILCIFIVLIALLYNSFIKARNQVEEAIATMDVYLKKRYDLIPNLINSIKGYMTYEKETLEAIVKARSVAMGASSIEEKQTYENNLSSMLKSLFALSENYPSLKADSQFLDLQQQLKQTEEDIAQSRKYYNAVAKNMNTKVDVFPSNLIALLFGFKKVQYFTIDNEQRDSVKVSF